MRKLSIHSALGAVGLALMLAACGSSTPDAAPNTPSPTSASPSATPSGTTTRTPTPDLIGKRTSTPAISKTMATDLKVPWGIAVLSDGSFIVGERPTGRVFHVPVNGGSKTSIGSVKGVVDVGEGGLLGLTLSPNFSTDRYVYAYETTASGNRVVRMTWAIDGKLTNQTTILKGISAAGIHNGGQLAFGPDGYLYVTTGENGDRGPAQNKNTLLGKILRIKANGTVPADNPFPGSPVWSYGHRNVQGIAWDSKGQLWATEFGQNTWDELNKIVKGGNYGWPVVEGKSNDSQFTSPVVQWPTSAASPSGLAIVDDVAYLGGLRGQRLWAVELTNCCGTKYADKAYFEGQLGRIRGVAVAKSGDLLITTSNRDGRGDPKSGDDKVVLVTVPQSH